IMIERADAHPEFANGRMQFVINLAPKQTWHACIQWLPVIGGHRARVLPCSAIQNRHAEMAEGVLPPVDIETSHSTLPAIWRQAVADMEALRMADFAVQRSVYIPAAGIPWYVTLFGRDTLVVAMESISGFPEFAFGALDRLSRVQATDDNAEQDKEPGKIPHELRYGELATLGLLPFAPYFGTADATLLFLIVLSYPFHRSGEPERAEEMPQRAAPLYEEFNERFWWEEEGTYYLGLDGNKRPIRSVASNAGHCLANGIVPPDRAERVVDWLMQPDMWSGWGVR